MSLFGVTCAGDDARVRGSRAKAHLTRSRTPGRPRRNAGAPRPRGAGLKASDPDWFANNADTVLAAPTTVRGAVNVLGVLSAHLDENDKIRQRASLGTFVEASFDYAKPYSGNDVVVALPIELDQSGATIALYEYGGKVCAAFYLRRVSLNFALKSGRPPNSAWYPGRDGNFENFKTTSANQRDADGKFLAPRSYPYRFGAAVATLERVLADSASAPFMDDAITPLTTYQAMRATMRPSSRKNERRTPRRRPSCRDRRRRVGGRRRASARCRSRRRREEALVRCDDTSFALIRALARAVRGDAVASEQHLLKAVSLLRKRDFGPSRPSPSRRTACSASGRRALPGRRVPRCG